MAVSPEYQRLAMRGLVAELQELADDGGLVMMTADQIADRVGLCRRVAMRLLKDAETAGMIWRGIGKVHLKGTGVHLKGTGVHFKLHGHERERDHEKHEDHETLSSVKNLSHDHPVAAAVVTAPARPSSKPKKPKIDPDEDAGFEAFWTGYPRKVGKSAVTAWWSRTSPSDDLLMEILEGLDAWLDVWTSQGKELRWIPHPITWLNQRRWQDDPS